MRKALIIIFLLLVLSACSVETIEKDPSLKGTLNENKDNETAPNEETTDSETEKYTFDKTYFLFTINTQDYVYPQESVETINRIIDIHEKYNVAVDIYLEDQIFQYYAYDAPELVERLKDSEVVAISYHVRAPHPTDVDYWYLNEKTDTEELYEFLLPYEEYKMNLETGEVDTSMPGGYQFIKDTIGYAPIVVPMKSDSQTVDEVMARIYSEKGATWTLLHERGIKLGEQEQGMYVRPEDAEIKWYDSYEEYSQGSSAEEMILEIMENEGITAGDYAFVNLKMHENNFIEGDGTAAYWETYGTDKDPPFDLSLAYNVPVWPEEQREMMFQMYEDAVKYVSEHPELYITINAKDLDPLLEASQENI
ncbi:hypothetical protein EXS74_01710 [Candidatus Woesearchaeota archaeon]|nr:hypothetical protein [Candidatus Woesearchaeota archaeon]